MLYRLRYKFSGLINSLASLAARAGVKPLHLTALSLLSALLSMMFMIFYGSRTLYVALLLASGLFDSLDGAVARLTSSTSKLGAFLDSTVDRVSDVVLMYPLTCIGFSHVETTYLIAVSLLISYVRARGESLGLSVEGVGLVERPERIAFLSLIFATSAFSELASRALFYALLALSTATLVHRVAYSIKSLRG